MSKPIEIKVSGCGNCPLFNLGEEKMKCTHPFNNYDGERESEWYEYCPLKETETIISFKRHEKGN